MLGRGLGQQLDAINQFLGDVYSEGQIVAEGVVPADMVIGCLQYRPEMQG